MLFGLGERDLLQPTVYGKVESATNLDMIHSGERTTRSGS
jgi:hypothetical protein